MSLEYNAMMNASIGSSSAVLRYTASMMRSTSISSEATRRISFSAARSGGAFLAFGKQAGVLDGNRCLACHCRQQAAVTFGVGIGSGRVLNDNGAQRLFANHQRHAQPGSGNGLVSNPQNFDAQFLRAFGNTVGQEQGLPFADDLSRPWPLPSGFRSILPG